MANYEILPEGDKFAIVVVGATGARQTMLGFKTKEEAEEWIVADSERGPINKEAPADFDGDGMAPLPG